MTRKSLLAAAAIFTLGSLPFATGVSAAHFGGGGHVGGGHFGGGHFGGGHFNAGRFGGGGRVVTGRVPGVHVRPAFPARAYAGGGHRRHFWHGRWWYYGVGPCWAWSDVYGEYVWACD